MGCFLCEENNNCQTIKLLNEHSVVVCRDCLNVFDNGIPCSRCHKTIKVIDSKLRGYVNESSYYCEECYNSRSEAYVVPFTTQYGNYRSYGYKPHPKFHDVNSNRYQRNKLYLGVELEMGGGSNNTIVNNFCNHHAGKAFYFKSDCSISGYGCEVVTHPCTIDYHRSFESGWKQLLKDAEEATLHSGLNYNTGIHVHLNKSFFNEKDFKKIDMFINFYRALWEKIANRNNNHYAQYNNKRHTEWGYSNTRYSSVNFTNSNTVEIRIFCGNMNYKHVMAILEICDALARFIKNITWDELYEETEATKNKFKELLYDRYMFAREYCEEKHIF